MKTQTRKSKSWDLVEKEFKGAWLEFNQGENLCQVDTPSTVSESGALELQKPPPLPAEEIVCCCLSARICLQIHSSNYLRLSIYINFIRLNYINASFEAKNLSKSTISYDSTSYQWRTCSLGTSHFQRHTVKTSALGNPQGAPKGLRV